MAQNVIPHNPAGQLCMIFYAELPCRVNGGGGYLSISHWTNLYASEHRQKKNQLSAKLGGGGLLRLALQVNSTVDP